MEFTWLLAVQLKRQPMKSRPTDPDCRRKRKDTRTQSLCSRLSATQLLKEFTMSPGSLGTEIAKVCVNTIQSTDELVSRRGSDTKEKVCDIYFSETQFAFNILDMLFYSSQQGIVLVLM